MLELFIYFAIVTMVSLYGTVEIEGVKIQNPFMRVLIANIVIPIAGIILWGVGYILGYPIIYLFGLN